MNFETAISSLGLLGVGGMIGTYFRILWERKNEAQRHKQEFMEIRYKCLILLMYATLDFDMHAPLLRQHGRDFQNRDALLDELKTEFHNMILFASKEVLVAVQEFVKSPSAERFRKSALAMRADLWGEKLSVKAFDFDFSGIGSV